MSGILPPGTGGIGVPPVPPPSPPPVDPPVTPPSSGVPAQTPSPNGAAGYDLIASRPLIQVLSPTAILPVQVCTIRTKPSGVMADLWVDQASFKRGAAGTELTTFAGNIETIIAQGKATSGVPFTDLDDNGLQQVFVRFTVAYVPPGQAVGPITTDVDVPANLLSVDDLTIGAALVAQAVGLINDAYNQLVATANG